MIGMNWMNCMNWLARFDPGRGALLLAANVALQIAGVVLAAALASRVLASRNAALRHGIWLAALAWVCAAPWAGWGFQRMGNVGWAPWRVSAPQSQAPPDSA